MGCIARQVLLLLLHFAFVILRHSVFVLIEKKMAVYDGTGIRSFFFFSGLVLVVTTRMGVSRRSVRSKKTRRMRAWILHTRDYICLVGVFIVGSCMVYHRLRVRGKERESERGKQREAAYTLRS